MEGKEINGKFYIKNDLPRPLDFRTNTEIKRNFPKSCISCNYSKLTRIERNPENSFCTYWNQTVEHFNEGCAEHNKTSQATRLTNLHLDFLIDRM